jgi:hypothetical protein
MNLVVGNWVLAIMSELGIGKIEIRREEVKVVSELLL